MSAQCVDRCSGTGTGGSRTSAVLGDGRGSRREGKPMPDGPTARCGACRRAHGRTHVPRVRRRVARGRGPRRLYRAGTSRHGGRRLPNSGRWAGSGCGYPAGPRRPAHDRLRRGRPLRPGRSEARAQTPRPLRPRAGGARRPAPSPLGPMGPHARSGLARPCGRRAPTGARVWRRAPACGGRRPSGRARPRPSAAPLATTSRPMCLRGGRKRRHSVGRVPAGRTGGMYPWPRPRPDGRRARPASYERHVKDPTPPSAKE
jgi:hypothetical protein